jgi:hypothetical protein
LIIIINGDKMSQISLFFSTTEGTHGQNKVAELTVFRVPTKVHIFRGMPHHFMVFELPHPHLSYSLRSAEVAQARVIESIQWALADKIEEAGAPWIIESAA